jgi:hypothetical protein
MYSTVEKIPVKYNKGGKGHKNRLNRTNPPYRTSPKEVREEDKITSLCQPVRHLPSPVLACIRKIC